MLSAMNRIFPGRRYSPLKIGSSGYLAVLLARLFMIAASVLVSYVSVMAVVYYFTNSSFGSVMGLSWIAVIVIVAIVWPLTVLRDLLMRDKLGVSRRTPDSVLQVIQDDALSNSNSFGAGRVLLMELLQPFLLLAGFAVMALLSGDFDVAITGPVSIVLAVALSALTLWYLVYLMLPRTTRNTGSAQGSSFMFYAGWQLVDITALRIPRKFSFYGLPLGSRFKLVGFRTLYLINTALLSVVLGAIGFWVPGGGLPIASGWDSSLAYWIVFAIAFGSVPLFLVYTVLRDIKKARENVTGNPRTKELFMDELGVVPDYALSNRAKYLSFLIILAGILGAVLGISLPWVGVVILALGIGIPRLLFILWSRPYAPDNTEQTP